MLQEGLKSDMTMYLTPTTTKQQLIGCSRWCVVAVGRNRQVNDLACRVPWNYYFNSLYQCFVYNTSLWPDLVPFSIYQITLINPYWNSWDAQYIPDLLCLQIDRFHQDLCSCTDLLATLSSLVVPKQSPCRVPKQKRRYQIDSDSCTVPLITRFPFGALFPWSSSLTTSQLSHMLMLG